MISIFNGERDITPPNRANISKFKKRLHEVTVQIGVEERKHEQLRLTLGSLRPLKPMEKPDGRPTPADLKKLASLIASLRIEQDGLETIVRAYEREHPGPSAKEQQRTLLVAQIEQQRRYYTDAQLDAAAGECDPSQLDAICDELAQREQALIDFDESERRKVEHIAHVAKVLPDLKKTLFDQLATFDRITAEQQQAAEDLRATFKAIDALKDTNDRVLGLSGDVLSLALPFESVLRWNYDPLRPIRLFERWQRAYRARTAQAA